MARSLEVIHNEILQSIASNSNLVQLNSSSKSAIYRVISFIFSFSIYSLEVLFDIHTAQIDTALYEQKSGTLRWYRNMALAFQYGFDLITDSDKFNNGEASEEEIIASKIVKYCSVKETQESNKLFIKIASADDNGVLSPINATQLYAFTAYINEIRYAGVRIQVVNNPADILALTMAVYRDPLVIDANGNSILNGGKPVEAAIMSYLQNLPFDGELIINDFIAYLRAVPGVVNVNIISITSSFLDITTNTFTTPNEINVGVIPSAGYFTINDFSNITYVV